MTQQDARTLELEHLRARADELEQSADDYDRSSRNDSETAKSLRYRAQIVRAAIAQIENRAKSVGGES